MFGDGDDGDGERKIMKDHCIRTYVSCVRGQFWFASRFRDLVPMISLRQSWPRYPFAEGAAHVKPLGSVKHSNQAGPWALCFSWFYSPTKMGILGVDVPSIIYIIFRYTYIYLCFYLWKKLKHNYGILYTYNYMENIGEKRTVEKCPGRWSQSADHKVRPLTSLADLALIWGL
jgi:hypothetical protein